MRRLGFARAPPFPQGCCTGVRVEIHIIVLKRRLDTCFCSNKHACQHEGHCMCTSAIHVLHHSEIRIGSRRTPKFPDSHFVNRAYREFTHRAGHSSILARAGRKHERDIPARPKHGGRTRAAADKRSTTPTSTPRSSGPPPRPGGLGAASPVRATRAARAAKFGGSGRADSYPRGDSHPARGEAPEFLDPGLPRLWILVA